MSDKKIAVFGAAGRMGQAIINCISNTDNVSLGAAIDREGNELICKTVIGFNEITYTTANETDYSNCDAIITFTTPDGLIAAIEAAKNNKLPLVVGTTGISDEQLQLLKELETDCPVLVEPNMSIGINMMCQLLRISAKELPNWDAEVLEVHHSAKKDVPSGTAKLVAETIRDASTNRDEIITDRNGVRKKNEVGVAALRAGDTVGVHTALFVGPGESIEITHRASDRGIYATGAVFAASKIIGSKPGRYSLEELIKSI